MHGANLATSSFSFNGQSTPEVVDSLTALVAAGRKFGTVYADPPWEYDKMVGRAAARRHYRTMTLTDICAEPVAQLVEDDAHLHLWTTNGFLRDAFEVIEAWGFHYKSCFVWVKPQLGVGNYWRVSHEFLCVRSHKSSSCWVSAGACHSRTAAKEVGWRRRAPLTAISQESFAA